MQTRPQGASVKRLKAFPWTSCAFSLMHLSYFPWLCTLSTEYFPWCLDSTVRYPFFSYIFCVFSHICPQALFATSKVVPVCFYLLIINKFHYIQLSTLETKTSIRWLIGGGQWARTTTATKTKTSVFAFRGWGTVGGPGEQARHRNRVRWMVEAGGKQWVGSPPRQGVGGSWRLSRMWEQWGWMQERREHNQDRSSRQIWSRQIWSRSSIGMCRALVILTLRF